MNIHNIMIPSFSPEYENQFNNKQFDELLLKLKNKTGDEESYWYIATLDKKAKYSMIIEFSDKVEEIKNEIWKARINNKIGTAYWSIGDNNNAMDYYQKSLYIFKEKKSDVDLAGVFNNIGLIFDQMGDSNLALDYYRDGLKLMKDEPEHPRGAILLLNIGIIFYFKRDYNTASNIFEQLLIIYNNLNDTSSSIIAYHYLLRISIKKNNKNLGDKHIEKITAIYNENKEIVAIEQYYLISKALHLKHSSRLVHKAKAAEILSLYINEISYTNELRILATVNLTELKIEEYKLFSSKDILNEINAHLEILDDLAFNNNLYPVLVDVQLLKAKLSEIENNFKNVIHAYDKAEAIIVTNQLNHLQETLDNAREQSNSKLIELKKTYMRNKKIVDEFDKLSIMEYLKKISSIR
jgi:tetratricopeptide (TPR) repeat protein